MKIIKDKSLKSYNSFGLNVKAGYFTEILSQDDLQRLFKNEIYKQNQVLFLGGGSNILFTKDFDGLIVKNSIPGINITKETEDFVFAEIGAGVNWNSVVDWAVNNEYYGIENLALIPGTAGAAPVQNIGAYGQELSDVLESVKGFLLDEMQIINFDKQQCKFGYRTSIFKSELKGKFCISSITLKLMKEGRVNISYSAVKDEFEKIGNSKKITIKDVNFIVKKIRTEKLPDPSEIGNAGSFFKNPQISGEQFKILIEKFPDIPFYKIDETTYKIPAAWLIEYCGWKGKRFGDAGVHIKQPLVLVNYGNASGKEILELAGKIKNSVLKNFNILLEEEINII